MCVPAEALIKSAAIAHLLRSRGETTKQETMRRSIILTLSAIALQFIAPAIASADTEYYDPNEVLKVANQLLNENGNWYAQLPDSEKLADFRRICTMLDAGASFEQIKAIGVRETIKRRNRDFAGYFGQAMTSGVYAFCPEYKEALHRSLGSRR